MVTMTYSEAAREAVRQTMQADQSVWCVGEDLGRGGVFGQYKGLQEEFGPQRICDSPISEGRLPMSFFMRVNASFSSLCGRLFNSRLNMASSLHTSGSFRASRNLSFMDIGRHASLTNHASSSNPPTPWSLWNAPSSNIFFKRAVSRFRISQNSAKSPSVK